MGVTTYEEAFVAAVEALIAADEAINALQKLEPDARFAAKLDALEMVVERAVDDIMFHGKKARGVA